MSMDFLGQLFFYLSFILPIVATVLIWKYSKLPRVLKLVTSILVGLLLFWICYMISMDFIFHDGLGAD